MNSQVRKWAVYFAITITALFIMGCSAAANRNHEAYKTYADAVEKTMLNTNRQVYVNITTQQQTMVGHTPGQTVESMVGMDIKYTSEPGSASLVEIDEEVYFNGAFSSKLKKVYVDNICFQEETPVPQAENKKAVFGMSKSDNWYEIRTGNGKIQYKVPDEQPVIFVNTGIFTEGLPGNAIKEQSIIRKDDMVEISFILDESIMQNLLFKDSTNLSLEMNDIEYSAVINSEGFIQSASIAWEYTFNSENGNGTYYKNNTTVEVKQYGGVVIEMPNPAEYEEASYDQNGQP